MVIMIFSLSALSCGTSRDSAPKLPQHHESFGNGLSGVVDIAKECQRQPGFQRRADAIYVRQCWPLVGFYAADNVIDLVQGKDVSLGLLHQARVSVGVWFGLDR
jgi:hypothetical protein